MTNNETTKLHPETLLNAALDTVKLAANVEANSVLSNETLLLKVEVV